MMVYKDIISLTNYWVIREKIFFYKEYHVYFIRSSDWPGKNEYIALQNNSE